MWYLLGSNKVFRTFYLARIFLEGQKIIVYYFDININIIIFVVEIKSRVYEI